MDKLISVIVPVYNVQDYLRQCVDSITGQTYTNTEIILVDDGSTDDSGTLCDELNREDGRIRVIHKENGGLISAWTCGVNHSRGEYLCFLDSDDWWDRDLLKKLSEACTGEKEVVSSGFVIEREQTEPQFKDSAAPPGEYRGERLKELQQMLLGYETRRVILSRCMKLFSRELILDNLHFTDPAVRMGEDLTITVPALLDAERIVLLEGVYGYHYRYVESSMVHRYDAGLYPNICRLREILYNVMREKEIVSGMQMADREFLFLLFLAVKNEMRRENEQEGMQAIREICRAEKKIISEEGRYRAVRENVNRLLLWGMKHPSALRLRLLYRAQKLR